MKAIIATIIIINLSIYQKANAACEAYITDEWPDSRYTVADISGDNVVTDNKTGLMWKQCTQGRTGSTCSEGTLTAHTWKGALYLAKTKDFAGYTDWRVPNIEELRSIAAINCFNPAINETVFPNTPSNSFWSSSPIANFSGYAWFIYFDYGNGFLGSRDDSRRVRLVRSGQ